MTKDKLSYKLTKLIKSVLAALTVPVLIIYILVAKPDYTLMNGLAHVVLPVANFVGDVITWPIRAVSQGADWVRETSNLRSENKRLREKLDAAIANKYACDIALEENKKLEHEIDVKHASPYETIIADVKFDDSVFHHNTFLINRGKKDGVFNGMVVVSFENRLIGIITDCGTHFCRVRALTDADSNIAIRVVGSDVSGFLHGNGKTKASVGFFSDAQFIGRKDLKIITSNISGILPSGIYIGDMVDESYVDVLQPNQNSRVMILKFNDTDAYR